MMACTQSYDLFASLFSYPLDGYAKVPGMLLESLNEECAEAGEDLQVFENAISGLGRSEIEEMFSQTFDLNPHCCPEIGWHLFGERYERGTFMVWMREQMRELAINEGEELPDHLSHVLIVNARMEKVEADRFSTEAVSPAIERMISSLEDKDNPYENLLKAVQKFLIAEHGPAKWKSNEGQWSPRDEELAFEESGDC